jgi:hypothetical protein
MQVLQGRSRRAVSAGRTTTAPRSQNTRQNLRKATPTGVTHPLSQTRLLHTAATQYHIMVHTKERAQQRSTASQAAQAPAQQSGGWYKDAQPQAQSPLACRAIGRNRAATGWRATAAKVGVLNVKCMPRQVRKPRNQTTRIIPTQPGTYLTLPARLTQIDPARHPALPAAAWPMLQRQAHYRGTDKQCGNSADQLLPACVTPPCRPAL